MKTVLITGANRGLGLAHTRRFSDRGIRVYACCRTPEAADDLNALASGSDGRVSVHAHDALDLAAPARLAGELPDDPIDLLFNNAGVFGGDAGAQGFGSAANAGFLDVMKANALAPLAMAETFADRVAASSRKLIANQSSLMGSIADNGSGGYYSYRPSKAALNAITRSLAQDLKSRGVTVVALHPGWVMTDMGGPSAPLTPEASIEGQQRLFDDLSPRKSGRFFNYDGTELPW